MSIQNERQVRPETERYLQDAACATENGEIKGRLSEIRFEDSEGRQIITLHELFEQAEDADAQHFIWVALQTIEDPLDE